MYDARDRLRHMYGPGGLADLASGLGGLGDMNIFFDRAVAQNAVVNSRQVVTAVLAQQASNPGFNEHPPEIDVNARCDCLAAGIDQAFGPTPGQMAQLRAACQQDVVGFEEALRMQAQQQGVSIPACNGANGGASEAWYKQPKWWAVGLLGIVGVGAIIRFGVMK